MSKKKLDLSQELLVCRSGSGIKLIRPDELNQQNKRHFSYFSGYSVAKILQLPISFYFLDTVGDTQIMNQQGIMVCGYQSIKDSIGKSLFSVTTKESANELISNCNHVINSNQIKIFEENNIRKDGVTVPFLSIKSPWYDEENNIIGTFGCSIVLGQQPLAESLAKVAEVGLLSPSGNMQSPTQQAFEISDAILSEQENNCIQYLCKGLTFKEIAKILQLSPRTVETYINRAKEKLNCRNKSDLIRVYLSNHSL